MTLRAEHPIITGSLPPVGVRPKADSNSTGCRRGSRSRGRGRRRHLREGGPVQQSPTLLQRPRNFGPGAMSCVDCAKDVSFCCTDATLRGGRDRTALPRLSLSAGGANTTGQQSTPLPPGPPRAPLPRVKYLGFRQNNVIRGVSPCSYVVSSASRRNLIEQQRDGRGNGRRAK